MADTLISVCPSPPCLEHAQSDKTLSVHHPVGYMLSTADTQKPRPISIALSPGPGVTNPIQISELHKLHGRHLALQPLERR